MINIFVVQAFWHLTHENVMRQVFLSFYNDNRQWQHLLCKNKEAHLSVTMLLDYGDIVQTIIKLPTTAA